MANALTIDVSEVIKGSEKLKGMEKLIATNINAVLEANALELATKAKQLAPVDMGGLRASINPDNSEFLRKKVSVNAYYAPFIEFGTGHYADQYVNSLPDDWVDFARQFKGKKGSGNIYDFFNNILDWIKRKGIKPTGATYSIKSKRRTGTKAQKFEQDVQLAESIAYAILKKGIKQHPFLFPAYELQRPIILRDVKTTLELFETGILK
jgi:Bacteriophage HK97-gp10, putative tail-component